MTTPTLRALAMRLQEALDAQQKATPNENHFSVRVKVALNALRDYLAQPEQGFSVPPEAVEAARVELLNAEPFNEQIRGRAKELAERLVVAAQPFLREPLYVDGTPVSISPLAAPRVGERERLAQTIRDMWNYMASDLHDGSALYSHADKVADYLLSHHVTLRESAGPDAALREAVEWLDGVLNKLHGALTFGINENGDTALWHGDDNDTPLGVGDTVEEALLDARTRALSGPRSER